MTKAYDKNYSLLVNVHKVAIDRRVVGPIQ